MKKKITNSVEETKNLGFEIGLLLKDEPHVVILLDGDLGVGKTTLTQGIAKGAGVEQIVNSPTYTILKKYESKDGRTTFFHLDLYRLSESGDDFDLEEYIDGNGMVVVEWPFQVEELLPNDYLLIKIKKLSDTQREFILDCVGYPCKRAVAYV
ncbi:tRNA (adenosine(37)-N6)-threonylcarbamoyltransferase complex ATPase subunit type 1 TsaE [Mariniplasma anaerobium]|uniref:tRNA threonylcarbamoyladenosine biosynthesis protein TsaE n=1 Tax=Mariniplasma anaerobium TaxID=2735436 RepID=A0A7U9TJY8_9MOLU|nr:tRNA (adenosine(37)-N6)-threonylcarbamoyltransferase complex ATPase subunit type 1 TsaE [Mariniplasma anaerobium]BCR35151.1 tRNA (adenosine(37)-N6)-threonylcarbamoyltransferase complex ATPase subunit type 1 TsaE [Mariniplasma anaerobium]